MTKSEINLQILANIFADVLLISQVKAEFGTAGDLGRNIDGRAYISRRTIVIRRNPTSCDREFCLAHELAHVWQADNGLQFSESQADLIASELVGYSHFNLPENKL